ncbi:uncharacterized protein CBL_00433 [Carabus blaptoides fortunei]
MKKMGTKSYFFIVLFLVTVSNSYADENITEIVQKQETKYIEKSKWEPKKGPKLNSKQVLLLNQIVASYALEGIRDPLCKNHTKKYKEALRLFEPWALQMFDSSSKLQPGLIVGNTGELGSFEQCLNIYTATEYGPIRGQMCTLTIEPGPNLTKKILQIRNLPNNSFEKITQTVKFNTMWSVCLPDSCPVSDVERHFNRTLKGITEGLDLNISLDNESCVSYNSTKPISDVQWTVIIGFTSLFIFIAICTIYDVFMTKYEQESVNEALLVFSAYSNSKAIFSSDGTSQLDCLNGVRSLSIIWVVLGHRYLHTMYVPIVNGLDVFNWLQTIPSTIVIGGTVSVDSFFTVSGLLVSYLFFKTISEDGSVNIILFYMHRYLRVTPVLGAVALIYATLTELIGSGPIWNSTVHSLKDPCVEYWWSCLLHIQNYINPSKVCVLQTWYLTCDMQYYFFSPLVLFPMWKWPHFGSFLLFLTFLVAVGINFELAWKYHFNGGMPVTNELFVTKYFTHHYTTPYTRAAPYVVGIAVGYVLFKTKNKKLNISSTMTFCGWTFSLVTFTAIVFGSFPFQLLTHPYNRLESSLYLCLSRCTWAMALGWIIFACVHGKAGLINSILSCYVFKVIAKLSYCMFLIHMYIMFTMAGAEKTTYYFSNENMIYMFFGDMAFTLAASYILAISVEFPTMRLGGLIRKRATRKVKIDIIAK